MIVRYIGDSIFINAYSKSIEQEYDCRDGSDHTWFCIGSGGVFCAGALDVLSTKDKNRSRKAIEIAMARDKDSGGEIVETAIGEFKDLY